MAFTFLRQHFKRNASKLPPQNQHPPPPPQLHPPPLLHPPPPSPPLDFSSNQESLPDDTSIGSVALSEGERSAENTPPPPDGEQDSGICTDSGSNFSQQESITGPMDKDPEFDEIVFTADDESDPFQTEPEIHRHFERPTPDYPENEGTLCSAITRSSSDNFECTEEYDTGTLTSSADFQDNLAVTNESPSSRRVSEISAEEQDTDTNARSSPGDDLGEPDTKSGSSEKLEDENETSLSEIQSPDIPPPPPLPGLRFMGDHTTSSTTDSTLSTPKQIGLSTAHGTDLGGGKSKNLVDEIRAAAAEQHQRKMSNSMEMCSVPTSKRLSVTINEDIKAVIIARQVKLEQSEVDFEARLPQARSTFYQARIGVAPEDTELGRLFRKRAEKLLAQPSVESRTGSDAVQPVGRGDDEQPRTSEVSSSTNQGHRPRSEYGENLEDPIEETAEDDVDSDDDTIQQLSVHEVEDRNALPEFSENPSTNQEIQPPLHDKCDSETLGEEENEDDFDAVVKDLDQLLLENCSTSNLALSTDRPSVSSPSTSSGYFEMASDCPSASDSLELSPNSFGSECAFDDVDDDVITNSTEIVRERSKLLSQPLESYNILPPGSVSETGNSGPERSFTFKNLMRSFRKAFGAPHTAAVNGKPDPVVSTVDGKLEFDDNWSIHDTIREKEKVVSPCSLQDVFDSPREVRSLSEFTDSTRDVGKDFSVRNWQDVLERSSNIGGPPEDQLGDALVFLGSRSTGKSKKSSKSRTTEVLDDISSELSNTGSQKLRLASPGLNSTIPSRRNHVILQSLDSIFPVSHQAGQRHYQKQHYSMSAIASNALLSPVVRRQQRSQKK